MIIAIDDEPVALLSDALLPGEIARHGEHVPDQRFVLVRDVVRRRDHLIGHDEDIRRRPRPYVTKGGDAVVAEWNSTCGSSPEMIRSNSVGMTAIAAVAELNCGLRRAVSLYSMATPVHLGLQRQLQRANASVPQRLALKLNPDALAARLAKRLLRSYLISGDRAVAGR